jgi:polysaccharide biosynthesis transport protein
MSRNFELLRRFDKQPEELEASAPAAMSSRVVLHQRELPKAAHHAADVDWSQAFDPLKKHWRSAVLFAVAVLVLTATATFIMKPVYEPEARAEIDPPGAELFSLSGGGMSSTGEPEYMETQSKNLQSDQLAINVIHKLQLDQDPEFSRSANKSSQAAVTEDSDKAIRLTPAEASALRIFREDSTVTRDTGSRLVTVKFASHNPVVSANVVNTLLDQFVEMNFETRHKAIMQSSEWLAKQLDDIKGRMDEANKALSDFQKSSGIAAISEGESTVGAQMSELNRELTTAQADRIQLQALLEKVQGSPDTSAPQITSDPVLQELTKKLAETRGDLSQALAIYGKNNPNAKKLENQVDELQTQIVKQRQAILSGLNTSYAAARARENLMQSQVKDTSKELNQLAQYESLKKTADANVALYNSLYGKIKEAGIAAESKSSNIRVIDHARILTKPTRPNWILNLALGLFGGLIGGVLLAFVQERFDRSVYTAEDMRKYTGISSVSILPLAAGEAGRRFLSQRNVGLLGDKERGPAQIFLLDNPHSPEAEALRGLYTSVRLSSPGRPPQALLVASCFPGEGKTTIAVNLAIALAQHGTTCIIDGDLRRPGVARAFGVSCQRGLGDVLVGSAKLEEVLVPVDAVPNLTILPSGPSAPAHPGELVSSESMSDLLSVLRRQFEFVLVDSPPILPYADGRALSPLMDGVILVGRAGFTNREALARSMELLTEVHSAPVLEVVLNGADFVSPDYRYYGYGYDGKRRASAS